MSDLIDRQAAIDAIENIDWYHQNDNGDMVSGASNEHEAWYRAEDIYRALESVPSAQPEPQECKWVYGEDFTADCVDGYRCSRCGFFVPWDYNHKLIDYINDYVYCPKCGAKMGGKTK